MGYKSKGLCSEHHNLKHILGDLYFGMISHACMGENETYNSYKVKPHTGHLISVFLLLLDFYLFGIQMVPLNLDTGLFCLFLT